MTKPEDPATFRPKARRPRGFQDRRGAILTREREIVEKVLGVYQRWGFERLETSAFEYADALGKFLPDQDRPNEGVFALQDDDEQWMALRYDLTAPLARFVAENFDALPKPYRRCAAGPVWRNEKPGPGRFREFWQCDADTVGAASPAADAEMIAMACEALEAAGVPRRSFQVRLSDRRLIDSVLIQVGLEDGDPRKLRAMRAMDKLDRLGAAGVQHLLGNGRRDESGDFTEGVGLNFEEINKVLGFMAASSSGAQALDQVAEFVDNKSGESALVSLQEIVKFLGPQNAPFIDFSTVRGLEYYTGAVFEAELLLETTDDDGAAIRFGSVGGGGRYDDLVSRFKGQPIPATGFSIGVSRLAAALEAAQPVENSGAGPIVVLPFDKDAMGQAFQYAQRLRAALNRPAEVYLGGSGPKAQLKYADKRAAPVAVIVGGDELQNRTVTIKDLVLGAEMAKAAGENREAYQSGQAQVQVTVAQDQLEATVRAMLERGRA